MFNIERFASILNVPGVDQYILVDRTAKIFAHAITDPKKMAEIVSICGVNSHIIGKTNFRYLIISRKKHNNFFIFPVGKYHLGVIKQENIDNSLLAENVIRFLKDFLNRKHR
ncbi:MAG: hypothetical protein A3J80_02995 [Desulfobacula sp. RIFOXYB2_FULL_45_6]|nr:MAG: hypothetical protein A3J80_02995 [Desulfobacula sp. RIFOXYB2_FULL_45_6]